MLPNPTSLFGHGVVAVQPPDNNSPFTICRSPLWAITILDLPSASGRHRSPHSHLVSDSNKTIRPRCGKLGQSQTIFAISMKHSMHTNLRLYRLFVMADEWMRLHEPDDVLICIAVHSMSATTARTSQTPTQACFTLNKVSAVAV